MTIRYMLDVTPEQADRLQPLLQTAGIGFDPTGNLCAMPPDNIMERIFTGNDLIWLHGPVNQYLESIGDPYRVREEIAAMDPRVQYEFLVLVTLHSDWDRSALSLNEMAPREWANFRRNHPHAVQPAGE